MNRSRSSSRNEARNRFREQEEKLSELKANIISAGHNIKKSKTLINEKYENSFSDSPDEQSFRGGGGAKKNNTNRLPPPDYRMVSSLK